MNYATQEEPLGTPHERVGVPKGPQNALKWSKSGNFDIIFLKQETSLFKAPIMVLLVECESQGKIGTNGKILWCVRGLEGTKNDPKWVKIKGFKKKGKKRKKII